MNIWLCQYGNRITGEVQAEVFFFRLAAAAAARRHREAQRAKWEPVTDHGTGAVDFWAAPERFVAITPMRLRLGLWREILAHFALHFRYSPLHEGAASFRHGRLWIRQRQWPEIGWGRQIRLEWSLGPRFRWLGAEMSLFGGDLERDLCLSLGGWCFTLYLIFENFLPARYGYPRHSWAHDTGVFLTDDLLSIKLHHAGSDCHDCGGWRGFAWSCFPLDLLLGPARYSEKPLYEGKFELALPEGRYDIQGQLVEAQWKRPRWPFPQILRRAHLKCEAGIPSPGKGESAWDLDDRRTYSFVCAAETIAEGVEKLRASIEGDRARYGGAEWTPAEEPASLALTITAREHALKK